ncbi:hypothetical protein llap_22000 [Limosa lapponica baueri]|uniref:PLAT domain-containing protein n=1 Tax=Limosa lapponica baueri TaxID=1758121 RepID=A0A2I0T1L4_LIMLA|nr:hypothetical protein llap_22000 [Limosa lapponica baueri]
MIKPLFVAVIPYHITVTTGTEFDSSTDSRVFIIIMGPQKVETERLWLDLPEWKDEFADGSVEKFFVWGLDVGEIKKVETAVAAERHRYDQKSSALVCISKPLLVQSLSPLQAQSKV